MFVYLKIQRFNVKKFEQQVMYESAMQIKFSIIIMLHRLLCIYTEAEIWWKTKWKLLQID